MPKQLNSQCKELVASLICYFEQERENNGPLLSVAAVTEEVEDPSSDNTSKNLKIPLANGKVMNIPLSAINISEEVNKTGIWKQVNENNTKNGNNASEKKKGPKTPSRFKKKKSNKKEDELKQKLEKKLSIMREEEEDEGIIMKVNDLALHL